MPMFVTAQPPACIGFLTHTTFIFASDTLFRMVLSRSSSPSGKVTSSSPWSTPDDSMGDCISTRCEVRCAIGQTMRSSRSKQSSVATAEPEAAKQADQLSATRSPACAVGPVRALLKSRDFKPLHGFLLSFPGTPTIFQFYFFRWHHANGC